MKYGYEIKKMNKWQKKLTFGNWTRRSEVVYRKTVTPLFYMCFHGVKSVYNKKIRRFFRNRYKDIFVLKKSFRGLKVKYFFKELREYAKVHEYE